MNLCNKQFVAVVMLVVMLSTGGCIFPESNKSMIEFEGDFNETSDGFVMEGRLIDATITSDPQTYQDVTVYLYAENESTVREVPLGDLERAMNVSVRSDRVPKYVIFDSPDFYGGEVDVAYYTVQESGRSGGMVDEMEELPVQPG